MMAPHPDSQNPKISGNGDLAEAARRMADTRLPGSVGRSGCACAAVALRYTRTPAAARGVVERHQPLPEAVRAAALAVIDQLAAEFHATPREDR